MIETKTTTEDAGKRCDHCGCNIARCTTTWWIANHGEYCSAECGVKGAAEFELAIQQLEMKWKEEGMTHG
jgi:hypothetical protein